MGRSHGSPVQSTESGPVYAPVFKAYMVTWCNDKEQENSRISRVDFGEPRVTLRTLGADALPAGCLPAEALPSFTGACGGGGRGGAGPGMWGRDGSGGSDASERGVLRERVDGAARASAARVLREWRERSGAEGAGVLPAWMRRESCVKSGEEWVVLAHYRQQYPGGVEGGQ